MSAGESWTYVVPAERNYLRVGSIFVHQGRVMRVIEVGKPRMEPGREEMAVDVIMVELSREEQGLGRVADVPIIEVDLSAENFAKYRSCTYTFRADDPFASKLKPGDLFGKHMIVVAVGEVRDSLDGTERVIDITAEAIDRGGPVQ